MHTKFQLPTSPAQAPRADAARDPEPTLFGRRLGVVLSLLALLPLPFLTVTSCGGGAPVATSGLSLFSGDGGVLTALVVLVAALLTLARVAPRLRRPGHRFLVGVVELLLVLGLWVDAQLALFDVGFFDKLEPLPAGIAAALLLLGLSVDVAWTLGARAWRFAQSIRAARIHSRQASTAGSSGEMR